MDAGNFAWKTHRIAPARLEQQRRKARLQLDAFALAGIDAVLVGEGDVALGPAWLVEQAAAAGVPLVASNLRCEGVDAFPPAQRVERGGRVVALVGALDPGAAVPEGCTVSPPGPALKSATEALGAVDLVIALSRLPAAGDEAIAQEVPQIDLFVGGGHSGGPVAAGGAARIELPAQAKALGVATLRLVPGARGFAAADPRAALQEKRDRMAERLEMARKQVDAAKDAEARARAERRVAFYEAELPKMDAEIAAVPPAAGGARHGLELRAIGLGADLPDHPATAALVAAAKADIEAIEARAAAASPGGAPTGGAFAGSAACLGCHPGPAAQWSATPHARAWDTLVAAQRQLDLDCWSCHATGAGHPDGPQRPADVGALAGVGCEACHGPGAAHASAPAQVRMRTDPPVEVCTGCHDGDRDGGRFDLGAYRPRVVHGPAPAGGAE